MFLKELVPTRHQRANTDDAGNRGLVPTVKGASATVSTLTVTGDGVDDGVNIGDATVSTSATMSARRCRRRRDGVGVGTK